jgi:AAA+ ATPase superfamily predicted ATPase
MAYITRQLEQVLKKQLDKYPILAVTGPRQSGKTTLLEHLFPDYAYVSLENENVRSFAVDDPVGFLKNTLEKSFSTRYSGPRDCFPICKPKWTAAGKWDSLFSPGRRIFIC